MGEFKKYVPGQTDKESQYKRQLSGIEYLIYKPHSEEGIKGMTKEEIDEYISLDEDQLKQDKLNPKTIVIFSETKKFLEKNYEEIMESIKQKENSKSTESEDKEDEREI